MAGDLIRETRRAALAHMKSTPALTALVPAASMYPSTTPPSPAWPFTRMDGFSSTPLDGACYAGATVSFLLHGFARDRLSAGAIIETAEDHASRIASALKLAVHNRRVAIALPGAPSARLTVRSVRLLRDGDEEGAYHVVLSVEARVLAD